MTCNTRDLRYSAARPEPAQAGFQQRKVWTHQPTTSRPLSNWNFQATAARDAKVNSRAEFYYGKYCKMELEKYQDFSWFQSEPSSMVVGELLPTKYQTSGLPEPEREDESCLAPAVLSFDQAADDYNINYEFDHFIKKADSVDSLKNMASLADPADVIPISYQERLHGGIKVEDEESIQHDPDVGMEVEVPQEEHKVLEQMWGGRSSKAQLDLDLQDLTSLLTEPAVVTPDLDPRFLDFINCGPESSFLTQDDDLQSNTNSTTAMSIPTTVRGATSTFQAQRETCLPIPRHVTSTSHLPNLTIKTEADVSSTINIEHLKEAAGTSIAERIKTANKRRRTPKYSMSEEEDNDDDDEDYTEEEEEDDVGPRGRKFRKIDGCSEDKDKYKTHREKNNAASRKSRENKKQKEKDLTMKLQEEEKRNIELKARAQELEENLVASHRQMALQFVLQRGSAG